jgi:hypothetical protein
METVALAFRFLLLEESWFESVAREVVEDTRRREGFEEEIRGEGMLGFGFEGLELELEGRGEVGGELECEERRGGMIVSRRRDWEEDDAVEEGARFGMVGK